MTTQRVEWSAEFLRAHPELARLVVPKLTKYVPAHHDPMRNPKQAAFLVLDVKDALYGGAAGGGKSDALLMAALQYVDHPGYNALILRRTYTELAKPEALLFRASEWLGPTDAKWNGNDYMWTFPSGATLSFGYLARERDRDQYQSAAYQFIGIDELTEFPEPRDPLFLFSRLRRLEGSRIPIRFRAATNPIGPGADWVYRRYLVHGRSYVNPITREPEPKIFLPATLEDSRGILDVEEYLLSLAELDPATREALIRGIWRARGPGRYFRRSTIDRIDRANVPDLRDMTLVRWWDLAASEETPENQDPDYTVGLLLGFHPATGLSYVLDIQRGRLRPAGVEALIGETAEADADLVRSKAATRIVVAQDPGAAGKIAVDQIIRRVLQGYAAQGVKESGDKEVRARPVSAQADRGNVVVVEAPWTEEFLDELEGFPDGPHDDQVDALSGAYAMSVGRAEAISRSDRGLWSGRPGGDSFREQARRGREGR